MTLTLALVGVGAAALLAWLVVLCRPARPWDLQPVAEDAPPSPPPARWPSVAVVVPARNEAAYLPRTLPALAAQDYPGAWWIVVVDDRSDDGTGEAATASGGTRTQLVAGGPLPPGWVGKVWAMAQGAAAACATAEPPDYLLFTDADIRHDPASLRRLVAEAEAATLALNSRMARLRTSSAAERLLIPPFVLFFNLLYPMRRANDPRSRLAAAAGGCVLLRREALERAGGMEAIRGEIIDDVNLARAVKRSGGRIRLSVSRSDVTSLREYGAVGPVWRMVRRSAFDELRYSWLLLAGAVASLLLLFLVPPGLLVAAAAGVGAGGVWRLVLASLGVAAWAVQAAILLPTLRYFELRPRWAASFPLAGLMYGGMTVDSALRHALGRDRAW